jgi:predicted N-acetyltransferase YhbS
VLEIKPIAVADPAAVEAVLDAAFGKDRHGRTAYRLRAGVAAIPALSFVAFDDGVLVGTLQSWPIRLDSADGERLVLVGPVAVLPDRQRQGIGVALMNRMLAAADAGGEDALMLIGDADYYERLFGFSAEHTSGWDMPGPVDRDRVLARLTSTRLQGRSGMLGPATPDMVTLR